MGQLPQIRSKFCKILAGARFGRISKKGPDTGFTGAEIRYIPTLFSGHGVYTIECIA